MPRHVGEQHCRYGNINPWSIAYATRLGLGPTNPGTIIVAQETLLFRWAGFSPALWLLIPAFSLDSAPPDLAVRLQCPINAPLPPAPLYTFFTNKHAVVKNVYKGAGPQLR